MTVNVVPALIPRSHDDIVKALARLKEFAREVQIDVVDGVFVSAVSWPYGMDDMRGDPSEIALLSHDVDIEFDLMVANPEVEIERYLAVHPKSVIVHSDSFPDVEALAGLVRGAGARFCLACTNDTPLEVFLEDLSSADSVQCMGITPVGAQGKSFDERTIERVRAVRERFPEIEIAVDGSVNKDTIPLLKAAGATRFVCGSAILGAADPGIAYRELTELAARG
jgi:ribulose-phosphate 3-epimerase